MTDGRRAWELAQLRRPEGPRHATADELPDGRGHRRSQWSAYLDERWWRFEYTSEPELRRARASAYGFAKGNDLHAEARVSTDDGQYVLFLRLTPRSSPNGQT